MLHIVSSEDKTNAYDIIFYNVTIKIQNKDYFQV